MNGSPDQDRHADTHIRVSKATWKDLNGRKEPGDSFEDVIRRLLEETDGEADAAAGNKQPA